MSRELVDLATDEGGLPGLDERVTAPTYDRAQLRTGIVHFGIGGFHRAHLAAYLDELMRHGEASDWALTGVGVLPHDRAIVETLQAQGGRYTLVIKHADGRLEPRVIGSIREALLAPDDPELVLARLTDPAVRIVSMTITEGGYLVNQVTGELDAEAESIQPDLVPGATPSSVFGYVVEGLRRRRAAGIAPFVVMSCDNLPGNGDVARAMITAFTRLTDPDLADWIAREVAFPTAMVDRITPVTSPGDIAALEQEFGVRDGWPVVCEPFTQWVLEDDFPHGRPAFEQVGAQLVDDVVPYELMKLRLLNASHQALCYLGYLAGHRYAHEVMGEELFRRFLLAYMTREGMPTLPEVAGVDLDDYAHTLIERFANPEIRDTLARLCAESSDRIPKWLVPVIRDNLAAGGEVELSALVVASWARYATGEDEEGRPIDVVDRIRERVMAAAVPGDDELAFLRDPDLFGDLADDERFTAAYREALASLREVGARATVERWVRRVGA